MNLDIYYSKIKNSFVKILPNHWSIKGRVIISGLILMALSITTPIYLRSSITGINTSLSFHSVNLETLQTLNEIALDLENLRSKSLPTKERLLFNLTQISKGAGLSIEDKDELQKLIKKILDTKNSNTDISNAILEINRVIATTIETSSNDASHLKLITKKTLSTITIGGLLFFLLFLGLMASLWMTFIPQLYELLNSAHELKKGNLKHRVILPGKHYDSLETVRIARAFNEMSLSLAEQNRRHQELSQMKSEFVATVSHELKTPLTAIKGSLSLILSGITGPLNEKTKEFLEISFNATNRLIRLVNDILDIAKIEAGEFTLKKHSFSVNRLAKRVISLSRQIAENKKIKVDYLEIMPDPALHADEDRIEQVLLNLLSNAIKFSPDQSTVSLKIESHQGKIIFKIKDNGPGLPNEFLERIFEKFSQAHNSNQKSRHGTGLGLAISKSIVKSHHGDIWVASELGSGSEFSFSIPWSGEFEVIQSPNQMIAS